MKNTIINKIEIFVIYVILIYNIKKKSVFYLYLINLFD